MSKKIILAILALIAVALCNDNDQIIIHSLPNTESYQMQVELYWTEERMARAIPYEISIRNQENEFNITAIQQTGFVARNDYSQMPFRTVGKIFFKESGQDYVCSGSVAGNNAILTAAHCISNGKGRFHTNWVFRPQYYERNSPLGTFVSNKFVIFRQYHENGYLGKDVAFTIVNKLNGRTVEDVVGAKLGYQTGAGRGTNVRAIGYPVPQYGGQRMVNTVASITYTNNQFRPASIGIVSKMQGGCSGGPWVCGDNLACGVNSYGYQGQDNLFSPSFDAEVTNMREIALKQ